MTTTATLPEEAWDLQPGDRVRRKQLHERFGGARQGGISPSRTSPNVFLFTDPAVGALHGYYDRWDGPMLHYTGEGQRGDQQKVRGNKAILHHVDDGRALRLFEGSAGEVEYLGEFALDPDNPYYLTSAPETGGGPSRNVIMFRLLPVGGPGQQADDQPGAAAHLVPAVPELRTPYRPVNDKVGVTDVRPFQVDPDVVDRGIRGHKTTQNALAEFLGDHGMEPRSPGPGDPGFDVGWWRGDTFHAAEVKSLTPANEDGQLRLAIGQVLDYAHQIARAGRLVVPVIVVERQPRSARWQPLCAQHGITLVWPETLDCLLP